jgi:hypothetical protein
LQNIIQLQSGANNKIKGTDIPNSHPNTRIFFLPHLSDILPAKRFKTALTAPKLAINYTINALDSIPNSFLPISRTTVCSKPTMAPTNALTKTRTRNWLMFGRKPNLIAGALLLLLLLVILLSSSNQRYTADMIKH